MPPNKHHKKLVEFTQKMQKPLAGLGLIMPGSRGKMLRNISHLEEVLAQAQEGEDVLERIYQTAAMLVKNVKVTNRIMTNIQQATGEYQARIEELDKGLQARLTEVHALQEQGLKLRGREERVGERERQAEALLAELNRKVAEVSALEHSVKAKVDETVALTEQTQLIESKVSTQQAALSDAMTALQGRREKMDQYKMHLQAREDAVTKSMNQLADLAQQKKSLQAELEELRRQSQAELDRGDELLRERELSVATREEEVGNTGLLLVERERALHERQRLVEKREGEVEAESRSLQKIREDLTAKEQRIADLQATVESLESQRNQLNRAIAGLSSRL